RAQRAHSLQQTDPAAAGEGWSNVDRELVDQAPWAPLYNPRTATALAPVSGTTSTTPSGTCCWTSSGSAELQRERIERLRARRDQPALRPGVDLERLEARLATEPRLLVAAERDAGEGCVRHVDPDRSRLDPAGDPVPAGRVARPDGRHQPVLDVVGDPDRVLLVLERDHRHHRAEDLLLRDCHRVVHLREHGRRVEGALAVQGLTAGYDLGAFVTALFDVAVDPVAVVGRDQRTDLGVGVERVADLEAVRRLAEAAHELVVQRRLDENARAGLAALAGRVVDRPDRARDRVLEVR